MYPVFKIFSYSELLNCGYESMSAVQYFSVIEAVFDTLPCIVPVFKKATASNVHSTPATQHAAPYNSITLARDAS